MNAIEFSQQKELKEVITGHIKTSAIYCFGRNVTAYSSSRKIYGKKVGSQIITLGDQVLDDFGRDLSSKYTDFENKKVIGTFSYVNILKNNLIIKTVTNFENEEVIEFYEYSNFDKNNNPQKIIIFESDKKKIKKIIIREFTYY